MMGTAWLVFLLGGGWLLFRGGLAGLGRKGGGWFRGGMGWLGWLVFGRGWMDGAREEQGRLFFFSSDDRSEPLPACCLLCCVLLCWLLPIYLSSMLFGRCSLFVAFFCCLPSLSVGGGLWSALPPCCATLSGLGSRWVVGEMEGVLFLCGFVLFCWGWRGGRERWRWDGEGGDGRGRGG